MGVLLFEVSDLDSDALASEQVGVIRIKRHSVMAYLLVLWIQGLGVHSRPSSVVGLDSAFLLLLYRAFKCLFRLQGHSVSIESFVPTIAGDSRGRMHHQHPRPRCRGPDFEYR